MTPRSLWSAGLAGLLASLLLSGTAVAQRAKPIDPDKARVIEHWTGERRAAAIPRDLVIDHRGLGYLKRPDGKLAPYGHNVAAEAHSTGQQPTPLAKPDGGGGGGGKLDKVANALWTTDSPVKNAAGRVYFEMPNNVARTSWAGYVCSGTVANDGGASGRSVILTAAHCIYDDANIAFARNVMFIPNQDDTTGSGTDLNCANDPIGCWVPSFGVVEVNWTTRTFPDNIPWDYAFYVVADTGAHQGAASPSQALDAAAGFLTISFSPPSVNLPDKADYTYALGYSYRNDPNFMYCAQDMTTNGSANWWLSSCQLSGGSSGGPWVQDGSNQWAGGLDGSIISVNSWGYSNSPGMAGPKLSGTSALCIFNNATSAPFPPSPAQGEAGVKVTCN